MNTFKDIKKILDTKYPNKNVYVIADHHFYHNNIIKYNRPQYNSIEEMHQDIITKHNKTVSKDDIVIFLGDYSFQKSKIKELNDQLNGIKILILGNHDNPNIRKEYETLGFEAVYSNPVKYENYILSHHPLNNEHTYDITALRLIINAFNKTDYTNIHGHIHNETIDDDRFFNVSLEKLDGTPLLIGHTSIIKKNPEFINSKEFTSAINYVKSFSKIPKELLIKDYIYCQILNDINNSNSIYVYGSFALWKKYGFMSNIHDLDVGYIFNEDKSIKYNSNQTKIITDRAYQTINNIDNTDTKYRKKTQLLKQIESDYHKEEINIPIYFDLNLIKKDLYKDTDFTITSEKTRLEKLLNKKQIEVYDIFPNFEMKSLSNDAMIANHLLQLLFGENNAQKEALIIKKIKHQLNMNLHINNMAIEEIMVRYLIRTVLFFDQINRRKSLQTIVDNIEGLNNKIDIYPPSIKHLLIYFKYSPFLIEIKEMIKSENIKETSDELIYELKKYK